MFQSVDHMDQSNISGQIEKGFELKKIHLIEKALFQNQTISFVQKKYILNQDLCLRRSKHLELSLAA